MMTVASRPYLTAEWQCTKCDVTNRKLVPVGTPVAEDGCVACHAKHRIWPDQRPVRWNAVAK
jgi:hypothetical protein